MNQWTASALESSVWVKSRFRCLPAEWLRGCHLVLQLFSFLMDKVEITPSLLG